MARSGTFPDAPEGLRFCKGCNEFLPIDRFHAKAGSRFECKTHLAERRAKYTSTPVAEITATVKIWRFFLVDCKTVWGHGKAGVSQKVIRSLLQDKKTSRYDDLRIVPLDPQGEWQAGNFTLVSVYARRHLVKAFRMKGSDAYQHVMVELSKTER
jgi:hypothetical protein